MDAAAVTSPHFTAWLVPTLMFLGGCAWAVTWFLIRRFIANVDQLAGQLNGHDGVVARLRADLVQVRSLLADRQPRSEADMQAAEVKALLEEMRREAMAREDRVLAALRDHGTAMKQDVRALQQEVSHVHARVDRILEHRQP